MATKWAIVSAGKISHDFVTAMKTLPANEHTVVAVAARDIESAKKFAEKHSIPQYFDSYEKIAQLADVDVVYIGSINTQHLPLAKLMISNGKNVLCEKPLCMNVKETKELISLAREKKVFLMEAVWSRFSPAYAQLRKELENTSIGNVHQVYTSFGFPISDVERLSQKNLGGGTVLDLGIYCIQFASLVFGGERPLKIVAAGHLNSDGVDESVSATLIYSNGRTATFNTHSVIELPNEAHIYGTKGTIQTGTFFWCPSVLKTPSQTQHFTIAEGDYMFQNSSGLSYEAAEVRRCLQAGLLESPLMSLSESLLLAEIMEEVRKQVGVSYPQDEA